MKKSWKIVLIAILALTFSIPTAFAQKVEAPQHVSEVCYSKTGKITVTIDADVYVPDIDRIPIYSAETRPFELEELLAMADAAFGDREYFGDTEFQYEFLKAGNESVFNIEAWLLYMEEAVDPDAQTFCYGDVYYFTGGNSTNLDLDFSESEAGFYMPQIDGETIFYANEVFNLRLPDDTPPVGCSLSCDEARRFCDEIVASFAPDYACVAQAIMHGEVDGDILDEHIQMADEEAWALYYTLKLDMPVTYNLFGPTSNVESIYAPAVNDGLIRIVVNDAGVQEMEYLNPYRITGILQEDCELVSFDQIMEVAEAILPLKEAWLEQHYEDIRVEIYDIRLGYMRVISRDTQKFEYIPVWDFFGTHECRETKDGKVIVSHNYPFNSFLTISALDGTIIDRSYGY